MKSSLALILALVSPPSSGWAEDRSGPMLALLRRLPAEMVEPAPGGWTEIQFVDHRAAAASVPAMAGGVDASAPRNVHSRIGMSTFGPAMAAGLQGEWEALVGFGLMDIEAHLSIVRPPEAAMLLQLDPNAVGRVGPALLASGYEEETRAGVTALVRGEDLMMDLAARNPADPFGGAMGSASRVVVDGSLVAQANAWPGLLRIVDSEGVRGHSDLAPMAEVIDRAEWGDVALVEAMVMPHQIDLSPGGGGGIPPWQLGVLADLSSDARSLTLALFSYANQTDATAAAERIAQGWGEQLATPVLDALIGDPSGGTAPSAGRSMAELTGAKVETGIAGDGPFVAWAALREPSAPLSGAPSNQSYQAVVQALYQRELALFGTP